MQGKCKMCGMCCRLSLTTMPDAEWTPQTEQILDTQGQAVCRHEERPKAVCLIVPVPPTQSHNEQVQDTGP